MGMQLVAPNRGELDLLRIAAAYEEATGFLPDCCRPIQSRPSFASRNV
jgi:Asp-tRNA(Asn)/Glu-tRNA(Gln) amidotransferase A subunit family amidase